MGYYVKSKDYRIREDKKQEVAKLISDNLTGSKRNTALNRVLGNKVMSFKRWSYYFDFDYLFDILEEVKKEDEEPEEIDNYDNIGI